ncbi:MAG TPA: NifB/NifX family molybdenum-iron cluster-binding protein [Spirochaetota bacterium]
MKIAIPSADSRVDNHFGHCKYFTVFTIDDNRSISAETIIPSPAGCGCKSNIAQTLSALGVQLMLAGNMGQGAVNVLKRNGIDVIRGCSGDVKLLAQNWLNGNVADTGETCDDHGHDCHNG